MSEDAPTAEDPPPTGVAALADRPVDGRRVARVMGIVGLVLAAACAPIAEGLLAGANEEPDGAARLRALAPEGPVPAGGPRRLAIVLVDGLRVDEARALPSWSRLRPHATTGTVRLGLPSLSRPFHHHAFTGVPSDVSGVRTNRFDGRARFDSVMDRVRAAGGRVVIVGEGLDWIRRMHGRPADGGSDAADALDAPLDRALAQWRAAAPPALLVVHVVDTDTTAHAEGVRSAAHLSALARADAVMARVSAHEDAAFALLSDHGHRDPGGHGGDEPEVIHAPILVRAPSVTSGAQVPVPIDPDALAPSLALLLGVARPRAALGGSLDVLAGPAPVDAWPLRAGSIAHAARGDGEEHLSDRRRWTIPLALFLAFALLGPIKRAWGFDRSMLVAAAVPFLVLGAHLAWAPLTLSAIDERAIHVARVLGLGAAACAIAIVLAYGVAGGERAARLPRAAATAGWSALTALLLALAGCGLALGPWPLPARMFYLPLLACGSGACALAVAALVLLAASRAPRSP